MLELSRPREVFSLAKRPLVAWPWLISPGNSFSVTISSHRYEHECSWFPELCLLLHPSPPSVMLFSLSQMLFLILVPVPLSKFKSMATSSFSHLQMMLVGMNQYFWLYEFSSCSLVFFAQIVMLRDSYLLSPPRERPLTS